MAPIRFPIGVSVALQIPKPLTVGFPIGVSLSIPVPITIRLSFGIPQPLAVRVAVRLCLSVGLTLPIGVAILLAFTIPPILLLVFLTFSAPIHRHSPNPLVSSKNNANAMAFTS